jgi:hypothetical protein
MQSTFISSHGSHCVGGKGATVFNLPSNVIVFMNCDSSLVWSDTYYDSACWAFATDKKLHLAMNKTKLDVNAFGKFLTALRGFNATVATEENNFCVFVDKCPDITIVFEETNFRSGVFTLPASVSVKTKNMKGNEHKLTSTMFSKFAENDLLLTKDNKRMLGAWLQVGNRGKLLTDEYFSVKNKQPFPERNYKDNILSKIVQDIAEQQPNKMHFIVVSACRASQKTNLKIQQYSATKNPYQTAIVVYKKVSEFLKYV